MSESETNQWLTELKSKKSNEDINAWIAPWPGYVGGISSCEKRENETICIFSQQNSQVPIIVDFEKKLAVILKGDIENFLKKTAFVDQNEFYIFENNKTTVDIGAVFFRQGDSVYVMFMSPELVGSMFTRLFFFEGVGLKHFEKFYDTTSAYGDRIITWKVRWP